MLVATSVAMLIGLKLHRLKVKVCRKLHYNIENPPNERFFPLKKRADSKNSLRNRFKKAPKCCKRAPSGRNCILASQSLLTLCINLNYTRLGL